MTKWLLLPTLLLAAVADGGTFRTALSGANQVGGPGDPDARGVAFVTPGADSIAYYIWVKDTDPPVAAHIHVGRASESGAVVIDLAPSFANPASGVFVAAGSVPADPAVLAAIQASPAGYYVNVHTASFPAGAVRGQLLGSGPVPGASASSLSGAREVPGPGDPDGSGFAGVVLDGADLYYYLRVEGVTAPSAAHIHRGGIGQAGPVVVTFVPAFVGGVASGVAPVASDTRQQLETSPELFYFNVHNDEFPGGALRGQLGPTEIVRYFPVVAHNKGAGTSVFKSDIRILNLSDETATVFAEWFPKGAAGSSGPAKTVPVVVTPSGEAVIDDAVDALFGANDRGAVRLVSMLPFHAVENTYNDQRSAGSGTFGQFAEGLDVDHAFTSGALLLNSNRPKADLVDFRTNLGYFNPNPVPVTLTLNVRKPDGTLVGTPTQKVIPPYANDLLLYYQIATGVPAAQRNQPNFFMSYHADLPVFVFSSVVDNTTDDGLQQPALPVPAAAVEPVNNPPDGQITSPAADVNAVTGQSIAFVGTASDPDGDDVTVAWSFGDGTSASGLSASHAWATAGTFVVTFTATDARGLADPTPATRTITVADNSAPDGTIVTPATDITAVVGQVVTFSGSTADPDGDAVTVVWDFGDSVSSTSLATTHTYLTAGIYTVTFTATDEFGLADPTPATRTVTVNAAVTLSEIQTDIFSEICAGCHPPNQGMDLRAGHTFASIVNVPSAEQPGLMRVKPGDPDSSYLIRKLEGGPSISGSRMPQGGPFLSASQIKRIRDWIQAGAHND